jgi:hypothetical protein
MITTIEIESLLYVLVGFALMYLFLEVAWHFTACKIKDGTVLKPCIFKELRKNITLVSNRL